MDAIATIITALAGLIPDPVEQWLAGGGNMAVIVAIIAGLIVYSMAAPAGGREGQE